MDRNIHFETVSRYDKKNEPAVISVPLCRGELFPADIHKAVIKDGNRICETQKRVVSTWEDGSVKWLLIRFFADLPANKAKDLCFSVEAVEEKEEPVLCSLQEDNSVCVKNKNLELVLGKAGDDHIFKQIKTRDHVYTEKEIQGPVITDLNGMEYCLKIDSNGWEILENGPLFAMLRTSGKHWTADKNASWMNFNLILTVWKEKPWINLDYQIVNCENDKHAADRKIMEINNEQAGLKYDKDYPYEYIKEIAVKIKPEVDRASEVTHKILTSSFNYHAEKGNKTEALEKVITADDIINTGNEMFPEVLFSIFTGDWKNDEFAVAGGIYQAYQNFPKALKTSEDGIELYLLPIMEKPLKVPQGVARTSRFYLYFRDIDQDERMVVDRALQMELPAQPVLSDDAYIKSDVFPNMICKEYHTATERFLYRYVDSRAKGLGMLHFGDGPEWEYMKQGRSKGELIWINNEYDMPHNFMIMLARTGDRRYFDYLKAAAEHWYDVDLCHYSNQNYKKGLLYTHSVDHVSGQPVPSHQWVEGFLDYYHLTGNPNGLEAAIGIGENLLKLMELPLYHCTATVEPRELGWAMRTFMALYREMHEEKWIEACRPIVEVYIKWAEELGTWTTPYPDNYMDRVPFMIHVGVVGLYQYYLERPEAVIRNTLLMVIDDMIKECYMERTDMFYGKQSPSVRFQNLNGMVLETLAIAYELTQNEAYIKKGTGMFKWITVENQPPVYDFSKYKQDEYTVIYNCPVGPKRCAQSLLPILHYYKYALQLGYLKKN